MSESAGSSFDIEPLVDFPHVFSDEELDALKKWGAHAAGLTDGSIVPRSEKESHFVAVACCRAQPSTRFQRVWLRYLAVVKAQWKLRENESHIASITRKLDAAKIPIEHLQEDVVRLTKWGKSAWQQLEQTGIDAASRLNRLRLRIRELEDRYQPNERLEDEDAQPKSSPDVWDGGGNDWREQK